MYALSAGMSMTRQRGIRRAGLRRELRLKISRMIGFAQSAESERNTSRRPHRGVCSTSHRLSVARDVCSYVSRSRVPCLQCRTGILLQ